MSHFASASWNNPCGVISQLAATGIVTATGAGSVEGTTKLTVTIPRLGQYRVNVSANMVTAGTGASQAIVGQVAYTNSKGAVAAADIALSGVTVTKLDATSATATLGQTGVYNCTAGSTLTFTTSGSGTFTTTGTYDLYVTVEAV